MLLTLLLACDSTPSGSAVEETPASVPPAAEPAASGRTGGPPDIVLITLDTLRPGNLPTYGYAHPTAPFLASLGESGHVFDHAWSTSSWTAPATASLFTSLYPTQHGLIVGTMVAGKVNPGDVVELDGITTAVPTLPEILKDAGYTTRGVSSNLNIDVPMGFARGFDVLTTRRNAGADELFQEVRAWPEAAGPQFTYLHLNDVHLPYDVRRAWLRADATDPAMAAYDSEIGFLDDQLRALYADMGWEDALVLVVSDHGEEFREHGGLNHGFQLHRELSQVVMIVHGPAVQAGRTGATTSLVDIVPTICELAGLPIPQHVEGRSLVPALQGDELPDVPVYSHRARVRADEPTAEIWAVTTRDRRVIRGDHRITGAPGQTLAYATDDRLEANDLGPQSDDPLVALLDAHQARAVPLGDASVPMEMTTDTLEHLQLLGYVE